MPEGRGVDMNGETMSMEVREAQSPLKSENSQPKRRSPLRACKPENVDVNVVSSKQAGQGMAGGPSTNGSDTKSRTGSNVEKFVEVAEARFRKRCEVRVAVEGGGLS